MSDDTDVADEKDAKTENPLRKHPIKLKHSKKISTVKVINMVVNKHSTLSSSFIFIRCEIHLADITWNRISTFVLTDDTKIQTIRTQTSCRSCS